MPERCSGLCSGLSRKKDETRRQPERNRTHVGLERKEAKERRLEAGLHGSSEKQKQAVRRETSRYLCGRASPDGPFDAIGSGWAVKPTHRPDIDGRQERISNADRLQRCELVETQNYQIQSRSLLEAARPTRMTGAIGESSGSAAVTQPWGADNPGNRKCAVWVLDRPRNRTVVGTGLVDLGCALHSQKVWWVT